LSVALRRGRITALRRRDSILDLKSLAILCDPHTNEAAWERTLDLADFHRLTVYDATYLELALRRSIPLATRDGDLRKAAILEDIGLLGM